MRTRSDLPPVTALALLVGLAGCHDWGGTTEDAPDEAGDAANDEGLIDAPGELPADIVDDGEGGLDVPEDDGVTEDDAGTEAPSDATDDGSDDVGLEILPTCGNGILEPGEGCEREQLVECTTRCGTRRVVDCPDDCQTPTIETCPPTDETCNGLDDDCDGEPDDGPTTCPGCAVAVRGTQVYHFCEAAPWAAAGAACRARGLHLVTIDDEAENADVSAIAATLLDGRWWMGFNDRAEEGRWIWDGPSPAVPYTRWAPGQPDDGGGDEDCGQLLFEGAAWNDESCSAALPYVCEYP